MAFSMNSLSSLLWVALFPVAGEGAVPRPMYLRSLQWININIDININFVKLSLTSFPVATYLWYPPMAVWVLGWT